MSRSSTPIDAGVSSSSSDSQEDLAAAIHLEHRALCREQREYARFLASCTEENLGPVVAAEVRAACGVPNPEHLLSSEESSDSDNSELAREGVELKVDIRAICRRTRRTQRRFARLLSRCTPGVVGRKLAGELTSRFGKPNPDHLASSASEVSDSLSDSEESTDTSTSEFPGRSGGEDDQPPPSGGSLSLPISAC